MKFSKLGFYSVQKILHCKANVINSVRYYSNRYGKLFAERLKDKCLIQLKGNDSPSLLQGLITNDVNHLASDSKAIYSMFLNNKGRIMFDTIIFKGQEEETYFLECDTSSVRVLEKHIKKFKLRKKVSLQVYESEFSIYSVYSLQEVMESLPKELVNKIEEDAKLRSFLDEKVAATSLDTLNFGNSITYRDPRLSVLGFRVIVPKESPLEDTNLNDPGDIELHKLCRYWLGIAEGSDELPYEQCLPLESNGDYLHGVSFHKGCYVGQELTARSHHTGVIRKRIMPVLLDSESTDTLPIDIKADQTESAKKVGKLRGYSGRYGVALLRINKCLKLPQLHIGNQTARCFKPTWWPLETPNVLKQEVS